MTCHKYMLLYKTKLSNKKISDKVQKEIDQYEEILDVLNITIWRKQAEIEVLKIIINCHQATRNVYSKYKP